MKGDLSRSTFRSGNHYSSVRLQQGRVLMDAEWNEQADIDDHVERTTNVDVIGPTGAPKHLPSEHVHFAVALASGGTDLALGPGRIYVDGILCETEGATYLGQPDLPGASLPDDNGPFAVYLDVWERHVTPIEQHGTDFPSLREVALGGPDTATRAQVVWQAKLAPVDTKSCDAFVPPAASTGQLRASAVPGADPGDDCLVPEAGGYRRLENQLYRVEVEALTSEGALVTWSRDNGSVVSRVREVDAAALVVVVEEADKDDTHGFATARFVELSDDERWRRNERGVVLEVVSVTGTAVTVANPDNLSLAVGANPTLRRWDGRLTLSAVTPVELEDGVQVEIDGGTLVPADHWVVPARTLTGAVEWPTDGGSPATPVFEPPHGVRHHYAVLAVVDFDGQTFAAPVDCRPLFPPLTAITADDVSYDSGACADLAGATTVQEALDLLCAGAGGGHCVVVGPGDDLVARFEQLSGLDSVVVCLSAGEWTIDRPALMRDTRSVIVSGTGPSTRVVSQHESGLLFEGCDAVQVRDLLVTTRTGSRDEHLGGGVTVRGARVALLERVDATVNGAAERRASCLTVSRSPADSPSARTTEWAVVRDCRVGVGDHQVGILVVDSARTDVTANVVRAVRAGGVTDKTLGRWLRSAEFARDVARRAVAPGDEDDLRVRRGLARHLGFGAVQFTTEIDDPGRWRSYAKGMRDAEELQDRVRDDLMNANADSPFFRPDNAFSRWLTTVGVDVQSGAQGGRGIVVAGSVAADVRVYDNTVSGMLEGITVAVSDADPALEVARRVQVCGNTVSTLRRAARGFVEPGIVIGNCTYLSVDRNSVGPQGPGEQRLPIEGLHVEGRLGAYAAVTGNVFDGTATGIWVAGGAVADEVRLHVARDNLATSGPVLVDLSNTFRDEGNVGA